MQGEESLSRLKYVCRIGSWLSVVAALIMVAQLVSSAAAILLILSDPQFTLPMMDSEQSLTASVDDLFKSAFNALLCVMAYFILRDTSRRYSPFTSENVIWLKRMTLVSLTAFAALLVVQLTMVVLEGAGSFWLDFPMEFIVIAVITYAFGLLIEYGTVLQTESDHFL